GDVRSEPGAQPDLPRRHGQAQPVPRHPRPDRHRGRQVRIHLPLVARADFVAHPKKEADGASKLVLSYATHDHSSTRDDPQMFITESLLRRAQALGLETLTYAQYHDRYARAAPASYTEAIATGTTS